MDAPNNVIGGINDLNPDGTIRIQRGNLIAANTLNTLVASGIGVVISGSDAPGNLVQGNAIGSPVPLGRQIGTIVNLGNVGDGVLIDGAPDTVIGGINVLNPDGTIRFLSGGNLIAANGGSGVEITNGAMGDQVLGNEIGTDPLGLVTRGNSMDGVKMSEGASSNTIGGTVDGAPNLIAANGGHGVNIFDSSSMHNVVLGNQIGLFTNVSKGNAGDGVSVSGLDNTIGGTDPKAGNVITNNAGNGITIASSSSGNFVQANIIGTDATGLAGRGNQGDGILVQDSSNNTIGGINDLNPDGTILTRRGNVIAGNNRNGIEIGPATATGNVVSGNLIGTDANGTRAVGNSGDGVIITRAPPSNTIGGTMTGAGNLIAGNKAHGINITSVTGPALGQSSSEVVIGNFIGTDVTGASGLGNSQDGILVDNSSAVLIGGSIDAMRNIISGNSGAGVQISGQNTAQNVVQGNSIGTNAAGNAPLPNTTGVAINNGSANVIGGPTPMPGQGVGNLISGNFNGVTISGASATGNLVQGDLIGTDVTGAKPLRNDRDGVFVDAAQNAIGGTAPERATSSGAMV